MALLFLGLLLASVSLVILGFSLAVRERAAQRDKEQAEFERREREERQVWAKRHAW